MEGGDGFLEEEHVKFLASALHRAQTGDLERTRHREEGAYSSISHKPIKMESAPK